MTTIFAGETRKSYAGTGRSTRTAATVVPATGTALEQLVALTGTDPELWTGPVLEGEIGRQRRLERAATVLLKIRNKETALRAAALYREVLAEPAVLAPGVLVEDDADQAEAAPVVEPKPVVRLIARPTLERTVMQVLDTTEVFGHVVVTLELKPTKSTEDFTHAVRVYRELRLIVDGVRQPVQLELMLDHGFFTEIGARAEHADAVDGLYVDAALRGIGVREVRAA
ncbi:hypothetical protein [Streptacidiphilus sp. EB129]|uniref:hypothetical protein n=1 Tax=Streptacidiphilus sp. EB129 TaxID=3156262 RepID=UPI0035111BC6